MSQRTIGDSADSRIRLALEAANATEIPTGDAALEVARSYHNAGRPEEAVEWCLRVVDAGLDYRTWDAAARLLKRIDRDHWPAPTRSIRLGVIGSYTTNQLVDLLRLSGARRGIHLDIYEAGYGLYTQEILDPGSGLYRHEPDMVLMAVSERELQLPELSDDPEGDVEAEVARWRGLWDRLLDRSGATVVQTNFAKRPERPFGHLSARLAGAKPALIDTVNTRLGEEAGARVAILDCDRLAALVGKENWFDDRYWHRSKQAVALGALPLMVQHVTAVIGAELGMSRKCLVLDLDGTLWGGVIGDDGLEGIRLGHGIEGEAFVDFQEYLLALKDRGVILAVCSKNDESTALEAFESHPDMRLRIDDIAAFRANWRPKPENIAWLAEELDLGTDSFVFVDDNAAEREAIRRAFPEIDVITLPEDPSEYVRSVAAYPFFETASFTEEDTRRTETYRARHSAKELERQSETLEDFLATLEMRATVGEFDDLHLNRIVQLIGKTNQFNLTTRRHDRSTVQAFRHDPDVVPLYLKLSDRFADHGLVAIAIGRHIPESRTMEIDTLLMSCRVIGRTAETALLGVLAQRAIDIGCSRLEGVYRPTDRNHLVQDLYAEHGFELLSEGEEEVRWGYDLGNGAFHTDFVRVETL